MSLFAEWTDLIEHQTDDTYDAFWKTYCDSEIRIYSALLTERKKKIGGNFQELADRFEVEPVYFMGFLDGVQTSLTKPFSLEPVAPDTPLELTIDFEKLYYNMHAAKAEHLYTLPEWEKKLSADRREEIAREWRRSRTVVKEKTPGRNDPCSCGSGLKYKKCCGRVTE